MAAGPDPNVPRKETRDYHDTYVAHRSEFFIEDLADDYVNVSRGELVRQTREEILEESTDSFGNTAFSEYRLLDEPAIGFSKGGSVAWSVFRPQVAAVRTTADGAEAQFDSARGADPVRATRRPVGPDCRGVESYARLADGPIEDRSTG